MTHCVLKYILIFKFLKKSAHIHTRAGKIYINVEKKISQNFMIESGDFHLLGMTEAPILFSRLNDMMLKSWGHYEIQSLDSIWNSLEWTSDLLSCFVPLF